MNEMKTVADVMYNPDNIVVDSEPARITLPQFDANNVRSLLVVSESGPLGIITRQRAEALDEDELNQPIRDFVQQIPVLSDTMSLQEAGTLARSADFESDRLPVVNESGKLVGAVRRTELMQAAETQVEGEGRVTMTRSDGTPPDQTITSGMTVHGSDDKKLGEVDQIVNEGGQAVAFTVKHGMLGRGRKRVTTDHITTIDDGGLRLDFGKMEFGQLADVEELEASRS